MVDSFTSTDARCIAESQEQFAKSCVTRDLTYILSNLAFLPMTITSLEEQGLPLDKALTLINNTKARYSIYILNGELPWPCWKGPAGQDGEFAFQESRIGNSSKGPEGHRW